MPRGRPTENKTDNSIDNKQFYVYDFRLSAQETETLKLKQLLREIAKKWVFQLEEGGETGYRHFQGRLSLFKKSSKFAVLSLIDNPLYKFNYLKATISNEAENYVKNDQSFYQMKKDTRIEGPWTDKDKADEWKPSKYTRKDLKLKPFQRVIMDTKPDDRTIHLVYCPTGNRGKTFISEYLFWSGNGVVIPNISDSKEIIQMAYCICIEKGTREPVIFVDLPRASNLGREIFSACETLKGTIYYDCRNRYKYWGVDASSIWVFCNEMPKMSYLSRDRWKIYTIDENDELIEVIKNKTLITMTNAHHKGDLYDSYFDYDIIDVKTPSDDIIDEYAEDEMEHSI